jgi:hypothetical protein
MNVAKLEAAYLEAVASKKETFIFDGKEVLTAYAKYLIQFLKLKT